MFRAFHILRRSTEQHAHRASNDSALALPHYTPSAPTPPQPLSHSVATQAEATTTTTTQIATTSAATLASAAEAFLRQMADETQPEVSSDKGADSARELRLQVVQNEIAQRGTYWHAPEELTYGARAAWRNSTRCIGRLHWQSLAVHDLRHLTTADEIAAALTDHLQWATNSGKIRSLISIFAPQAPGEPGIRIWNPQLIRYAGYRQPDGSVLGDPLHIELTEAISEFGWQKTPHTQFDVLPWVIQMPNQAPRLYEVPSSAILEVAIQHPEYPWFAELGLRWHALPVISSMRLEIGGISYPAAPFNGWYMGTEIGARNFGDRDRYNALPEIARRLGLDIHSDRSLWKDRALVELNRAVLHSFAAAGVTIVDHHTAARQFHQHEQLERKAGRMTPADWGWIVPPMSSSQTPVFHQPYNDVTLTPNFFYQPAPWQS